MSFYVLKDFSSLLLWVREFQFFQACLVGNGFLTSAPSPCSPLGWIQLPHISPQLIFHHLNTVTWLTRIQLLILFFLKNCYLTHHSRLCTGGVHTAARACDLPLLLIQLPPLPYRPFPQFAHRIFKSDPAQHHIYSFISCVKYDILTCILYNKRRKKILKQIGCRVKPG